MAVRRRGSSPGNKPVGCRRSDQTSVLPSSCSTAFTFTHAGCFTSGTTSLPAQRSTGGGLASTPTWRSIRGVLASTPTWRSTGGGLAWGQRSGCWSGHLVSHPHMKGDKRASQKSASFLGTVDQTTVVASRRVVAPEEFYRRVYSDCLIYCSDIFAFMAPDY